MHRRTRLTMLSVSMVAAASLVAMGGPAQAQTLTSTEPTATASTGTIATITDTLARQLAQSFADRGRQDRVVAAASAAPVDLAAIDAGTGWAATVRAANQSVLTAKGLPVTGESILHLRLAHPDMRAALARGESPWVAATPTDDAAASVVAYGPRGATTTFDVARVPQRPVLLVEVDTAKAVTMGMRVMRETLDRYGILGVQSVAPDLSATGGYWATKVNAIRLSNDQEPWIKGAAEIFNVVGGFGLDGKVKVDTVTMPYLDHDGTTYYPNQLIVHFNGYKYNLADVVMMEDDGDTNYLSLAKAIADALLYIVDGGAYIPLVNAILDAMPSSWWTDDPDYVDSWYTLSTGSSGRKYGAAANGWMDVVPYWVSEL